MNSPRRLLALGASAALLAVGIVLAQPEPERADANVACDVVTGPVGGLSDAAEVVTGGLVGGGNPAGDACNAVTDGAVDAVTSPVTGALEDIGNSIFNEITSWATDGATWLIGEVVKGIEKTTTPDLTSKGFLRQYGQMAVIASVLAMAMLLFAILEAIAQSSWGILGRAVFVSVPLAFLGTSVAFIVVQMLLVATDQMSHAVAVATENDSARFFKSAIKSLGEAGAGVGGELKGVGPAPASNEATGAAAVPLFVTFLAAIIGAFAAFFVWIELLMRDAAVYVVALFMPIALAASIWPRWSGALRRTSELLVVIIGSKFVIVSIIALAAGLLGEENGDVENILAAAALLLLACFAPFVLFKLVPFAEGAMSAAYGRRSAAGGAVSTFSLANEARAVHDLARGNWSRGGSPPDVWDVKGSGGGGPGPVGGGGNPAGPSSGSGGSAGAGATAGGAGTASGAGAAGAAAGPAAAAAAVPVAAAKGARSASERLAGSGVGQTVGQGDSGKAGGTPSRAMERGEGGQSPRAPAESGSDGGTRPPSEQPPRPPQDVSVKPTPGGAK